MSWISDFNKLHVSLKGISLIVAVLMPFWFISIYLFNKPLYNQQDPYILFSFCFCFSLLWFFISNFFAYFLDSNFEESKDLNTFDEDVLQLTAKFSVFFISLAILISYYYTPSFGTFLGYSFGSVFVLGFIMVFISEPKRHKRESEKKKT